MKPDIVLHKNMDAVEALNFRGRLMRSRSKTHHDHDADRQKVRELMKRTGQTELMDLDALHEWLKSDNCYNKKEYKIAVKDVKCNGTKAILEYLILGCGFTRA